MSFRYEDYSYKYSRSSHRSGSRKKLRRSRDGIIWGVCKGLADWLEIPAGFVRVLFLILLMATGFFPLGLAYILAAIFIPMEDEPDEWF